MNQPTALTRRDLAERGPDALDQNKYSSTAISRNAGGVSFSSALEVMEFAKLMSTADMAVPEHLRANPGACLRIVFQAVEWQMSPWTVADKSYAVNGRLAYESQLLHAIIEARAPLRERLNCEYSGEGESRKCRVFGTFTDGTTRDYETPALSKIKKKSPLWVDDPDQQLFYYGSRSWGRKWCPDVIAGLYTKDELRENPQLGRPEEETEPGLHARLVGGNINRDEGHQEGHAAEQVRGGGAVDNGENIEILDLGKAIVGHLEREGIRTVGQLARCSEADLLRIAGVGRKAVEDIKLAIAAHAAQPPDEAAKQTESAQQDAEIKHQGPGRPKNAREWAAYATSWIASATDADEMEKRWKAEMALRNDCGVTSDDRDPVFERFNNKIHELREKSGNGSAPTAD